ncbi:DUF6932 family protein [Acinetobacter sp. H1(2024)]|uniref:DUF6932 family protein n=1 Tax=Acinetobacter sp. H1(2024) TaxID=3390190 RepID=UPI00397B69BB
MNVKPNIFNMAGVIPPVNDVDGSSPNRSPYVISITQLIDIFSFTSERVTILKGLLEYRAELYRVGIISGYQWLDGSFTTDIETLEKRAPNDIDIVTFFYLPQGETQQSFLPKTGQLLLSKYTKANFKVDAYPVILGQNLTPELINRITYWYSMWSHRKGDNIWKGFLQVELSPLEDAAAFKILSSMEG